MNCEAPDVTARPVESVRLRRLGPLISLLVSAILLAPFAAAQNGPDESKAAMPEGAVALVNGEPIPREELIDALVKLHGDEVLRQLINTHLLAQYARDLDLPVVKPNDPELAERLDREIDRILRPEARSRGFRTLGEFKKELDRVTPGTYARLRGHHRERVRYFVLPRVQAERILRRRVEVEEEAVRRRYNLVYGPKALVRQIVVLSRAKAEEVLTRLKAGADFAITAMEVSIDDVSRRRGGMMDPLPPSGTLGEAAFALDAGNISDILRTPEGFHLLKLERKIPARKVSYDSVKERIREQIVSEKVENLIPELLLEIRGKSNVSVRF